MTNSSFQENKDALEDDNPGPLLKKKRLSDSDSESSFDRKASEDENQKKQHLSDSESDTSLNDNGSPFEFDEESWDVESEIEDESHFTDTFSDPEDYRDYGQYRTDNDVLTRGRYCWRKRDRCNGREVYCISVAGESPRKESRCLELLSEINCEERYLGCSVEMGSFFFANLDKDEASRIQAVEGVRMVVARRNTISDV